MDNLPSVTYQTFEQDPIKYMQYEEVRQVNSVEVSLFPLSNYAGNVAGVPRLSRWGENVRIYPLLIFFIPFPTYLQCGLRCWSRSRSPSRPLLQGT